MVDTYIDYPYVLHRISKDMASDRIKGMHKNYKEKDYYWGNDTTKLNVQGVLAELIAWHYFIYDDREFTALSMYGTEPEVEADVVVEGCKIDVKYIPHYAKYLMVNYVSHTNPKKLIDKYMFIQPIKKLGLGMARAKLWIVQHKEVDNWKIQKQTLTKVFCKKI
tara:strand:- start:14609 stop:15100 length:492 start_codon:yes stop_codon:yes gene_type:complete